MPWHFGDPHGEQRRLVAGDGIVDLSHLGVLAVGGSERLAWLHSLSTAHLTDLRPGDSALSLILDPNGRVEYELHVVEDGTTTWIVTEPESAEDVRRFLDSMRFMLDVDVRDAGDERAVVWLPRREVDARGPSWLVPGEFAGTGTTPAGTDRGGGPERYGATRPDVLVGAQVLVPRQDLTDVLVSAPPAGTWALTALRVAAAVPRQGSETDHRTLPHEVGWIGSAVHLAKGCYRGQETVARVHNMGRPPRRLVLLHLDGSVERLPEHGSPVLLGETQVGWVGTAARHWSEGPLATAIVKRSTPTDAPLTADGIAASQQIVVTA